MLTTKSLLASAGLLALLPVGISVTAEQAQPLLAPRSFALTDIADLIPRGAKTEVVEYKGRKALHIITQSKTGSGFTLLKGLIFTMAPSRPMSQLKSFCPVQLRT